MKHLWYFLGIVIFTTMLASCGADEVALSEVDAMSKFRELSPKKGAEFYMQNREQYTFLDTLYQDSIMPAVLQCNYFDLDSVRNVLKSTPFNADIEPVCETRREEVVKKIKNELEFNTSKQMEVYKKYFLPYLEMSIDSMLDEDVDKIMDNYAGGILNFRKLHFLFGRGRNDFKDMFWEKFDTLKYQRQIKDYVESFYASVQEQQNGYSKDLTGMPFKYDLKIVTPRISIGLSQSTLEHVSKYTSQQTKEIVGEAIKDYAVPLALAVASGGASVVYDIGNTAYDAKELIDDIKEAKVDEDDMVKYICSHDLSYQIKTYYLDKWTSQVYEQVKKSNESLYNHILKEL